MLRLRSHDFKKYRGHWPVRGGNMAIPEYFLRLERAYLASDLLLVSRIKQLSSVEAILLLRKHRAAMPRYPQDERGLSVFLTLLALLRKIFNDIGFDEFPEPPAELGL